LRWPRPAAFNTVQVTFDTNANRRVTLPLFRYPECVKDYDLEYWDGVSWKNLAHVENNYERRREHRVERTTTTRLRLHALATNGVTPARVYEIRIYDEPSSTATR
jgi:hypothetical protein